MIRARLRRIRQRLKTVRTSTPPPPPQELPVPEEVAAEFTTEELQEFLEGDLHPCDADPAFRESLRAELWKLVQRSRGDREDSSDG